jgi:hypothetical protein
MEIINKHKAMLMDRLDTKKVAEELLKCGVLEKHQFDTVVAKSTKKTKTSELLKLIESSEDGTLLCAFLTALKETQPMVYAAIPEMTGERLRIDLGGCRFVKVTWWDGEPRIDIREYKVCELSSRPIKISHP